MTHRAPAAHPLLRWSFGMYLLVACFGAPVAAGRAAEASTLTAWQEIVVLTVAKVRHASAACGFRESVGAISRLLASADLTAEVFAPTQPLSAALRRQIQADQDAYTGDHDEVCQEAWSRFGADGAPGVRDLLAR